MSDAHCIFDPLRNKAVTSTPEEVVRQQLLMLLTNNLGYPEHLIVVEKGIKTLSPILAKKLLLQGARKRPDVLVITPPSYVDSLGRKHELPACQPLLLIECKAEVINSRSINQLVSYNYLIGAPCLALVSRKTQLSGFVNPSSRTVDFSPGLPPYAQALAYYLSLLHSSEQAE